MDDEKKIDEARAGLKWVEVDEVRRRVTKAAGGLDETFCLNVLRLCDEWERNRPVVGSGVEDKRWLALTDAIRILDRSKRAVCHENMDAWIRLCHAKAYLVEQLEQPPRDSVEQKAEGE